MQTKRDEEKKKKAQFWGPDLGFFVKREKEQKKIVLKKYIHTTNQKKHNTTEFEM